MEHQGIRELLERLANQEITIEEALAELKTLYYEDIGHAKVDHHRTLRNGMPEVIYGPGKTPEQAASIAHSLAKRGSGVIVTRATKEQFASVKRLLPDAVFHETPRLITSSEPSPAAGTRLGRTAVLTAGTADIAVAEEAAVILEFFGLPITRIYDVGVAGLHRLLDKIEEIRSCQVVIVVAGMDGALPSVVAGMVETPVIAVPTSVGYGAGFSGLAPLLTMLNSCSPGIGVVNIDNGFGAAALAFSIIHSGGARD